MNDIIETYGLYWRSEDVYWGAGSKRGTLLGIPAHARSAKPVDFRHQAGLYALYKDHELIYVGQAGSGSGRAALFTRLKTHRKDKLAGRWDLFSWFGLRRVLPSGRLEEKKKPARPNLAITLNQIEAVLIAVAEPALNLQGGRYGRQRRYLQFRDDKQLGPTQDQMIQEIYADLDRNRS